MVTKTLETRLDRQTNVTLAELYNSVSERKISKFSDHSTAVKRTLAALQAAGRDFTTVDATGHFTVVDAGSVTATGRDGDDRKITVLADGNPKARGSKSEQRFALYARCPTVADYVAAASELGGGRRKAIRDIMWDSAHGYIRLG